MTVQTITATPATNSVFAMCCGQSDAAPLTRVSLVHAPQHIQAYLRFGDPVRITRLDPMRRIAVFLPGAIFCRVRWQANEYGTVSWQLTVMQGCTQRDAVQRIAGVVPGARLLLHAIGKPAVRTVLPLIDAIEAQGIDPTTVSPAYWRMLNNRLAARLAIPVYSAERHGAWLARRGLQ
ncbi:MULTISPECIES: DUF2840 domain-containing protein [Pseudomonadaceae]|uniref:DUF2840 domain-containing protein n=1 Tax=Pseudomonadaceae TaxID=135621 RepID=UPI00103D29C4|nr:DUF2840 domain-containing protein [Stutzerimonas stutzeri]TCD20151.1 DUF2840 domain-containing protein [Pseudomonas sp. IC_126]